MTQVPSPSTQTPTAADTARALWEEGLHVIPLGSPGETPPTWFHGRPDQWPKTARVKWREYQHRAPTEEEMDQWLRQWPHANWAVLTGSQVVVVDADSAEASAWVERSVSFTPRRTKTAKGKHFWFQPPAEGIELKTKGSDKAPIDFRGAGGYVVAPGSIHASGAVYEDERIATWGDTSWQELPRLTGEDIARIQAYNNQRAGRPAPPQGSAEPITPETRSELEDALRHIDADAYDTWIEVGQALHDAGQFELWDSWSQTSPKYPGPEAMRAKWASFTAGAGLTYRSIFQRAQANGWRNPLAGTAPAPKPTQGLFVPASEILARTTKPLPYLIKPYLLRDTLALLFGDPGAGKSAIALDMALHVAAGRSWHGWRVDGGSVFYLAGEGYHGLGRRLMAWGIAHRLDVTNLPIWFSQEPAQLYDSASAERFRRAIAELTAASGQEPKLIILDTLARNFGPGDENSTRDMSEFIAHIDEHLRRAYGACVLIVHHTGQAEKQRARGSSTLLAALDTEYRVEGEGGQLTLTNTKQKDGSVPAARSFWLNIIDLPIIDPDDNEPETSICPIPDVILPFSPPDSTEKPPNRTGRGTNQSEALDILDRLIQHHQANLERGGLDPADARVTQKEWRDACKAMGIPRNRFAEVRNALIEAGLITLNGPHVSRLESSE